MIELKTPALARRMACWLYEGVLLLGVVFITGYLFSALSQTRNALNNRHGLQAFLFVVVGIYFVWLWSKGQTLAMKTWGITILDRTGRPLTQARALLRYVLSWLWFLPALAALSSLQLTSTQSVFVTSAWIAVWAVSSRLHPQRQFWHDALAGTQLVTSPRLKR